MSAVMPRRAKLQNDAFLEVLAAMAPVDAEAITLVQEVHNNQVSVASAVMSLQEHSIKDGRRIKALEDAQGDK